MLYRSASIVQKKRSNSSSESASGFMKDGKKGMAMVIFPTLNMPDIMIHLDN